MASQLNQKRGSPFKKTEPSKRSPKLAKKNNFKLQVWGFNHLAFELYSFSSGPNKDGYLWKYRQHVDGDENANIPELSDAGFKAYYKRRVSIDMDDAHIGDDDYVRYYIGRFLPGMVPSTPETRVDGLYVLKSFFNNRVHTKYPPGNGMPAVDETDHEHLGSLDHFLLSDTIMEVMVDLVDSPPRNPTYFANFPDHARLFFSGTPPRSAVSMYGYPQNQRSSTHAVAAAAAAPVVNLFSQLSEPGKNNTDKTAAENRKKSEDRKKFLEIMVEEVVKTAKTVEDTVETNKASKQGEEKEEDNSSDEPDDYGEDEEAEKDEEEKPFIRKSARKH